MNRTSRDVLTFGSMTVAMIAATVFIASCASAPEHPLVKASDVKPIVIRDTTPVLCFDEKDVPPKVLLTLAGKKGAGVGKNSAAADIDVHALNDENKALRALLEGCKGAVKP